MKTKLQETEHIVNGRTREMRKDCKRQTDAKTQRETVSVKLRDRDIQEREKEEVEKQTHKARKVPGTVSRNSALAIESLVTLGGHFFRGRDLT